ncbi:hypothetical protein BG006_010155 [Podila minutissima]|uniref:Uncharacterized protein n=1 Tax=Podila minutissima TaxID=64525 RepID=A0A9P5SE31_9FUNG|nr:hypothetical protein BG006_010155 [Podila minutissima]
MGNTGVGGSEEQSKRVEAFVDVLCQFPDVSFDSRSVKNLSLLGNIAIFISEQLKRGLAAVLSKNANLRKIDCKWDVFRSQDTLPVVRNGLTSFRLYASDTTSAVFQSDVTSSIQLNVTVDLQLSTRRFTMDEFEYIMASTPNLQMIKIPFVCITGTEKQPVAWASSSLRLVSLGLYLDGHPPDLDSLYGGRGAQFLLDERDCLISRTTDVATTLAPLFLEQLNHRSESHDLELSFNNLFPAVAAVTESRHWLSSAVKPQ